MIIPTKDECLKILKDNNVPENIIAHSKAVFYFAMKVVDVLEKKKVKIDRDLVAAGALLHDVKKLTKDHEVAGFELLKSLGYENVGLLIKRHGLFRLGIEDYIPKTWEEKVVFYSDKRVKDDKIVSLEERFEYIMQRYNKEDIYKEIHFTKKIENELLGNQKLE